MPLSSYRQVECCKISVPSWWEPCYSPISHCVLPWVANISMTKSKRQTEHEDPRINPSGNPTLLLRRNTFQARRHFSTITALLHTQCRKYVENVTTYFPTPIKYPQLPIASEWSQLPLLSGYYDVLGALQAISVLLVKSSPNSKLPVFTFLNRPQILLPVFPEIFACITEI